MAHNAEEWRRLRSEFIEAAAKYDEYETFIERTAQSEDWYYNNGRYLPVGLIRWPYEPYRKCWIFAPDSGTNEEPFSTMKTLFSKAWLWLPRVIADAVLDTAEIHLSEPPSPPADTALFWANSHYQYWCWLLWFHWLRWLRQRRRADPTEAERPSQEMVLAPFHCAADLIAQWGLDGSDGTLPDWLSLPDHDDDAPSIPIPPDLRKWLEDLPPDDTPGLRPAYRRDHVWLAWANKYGKTTRWVNAAIRDWWNGLSPDCRKVVSSELWLDVGTGRSGAETVRTGLSRARDDSPKHKPGAGSKKADRSRHRKKT